MKTNQKFVLINAAGALASTFVILIMYFVLGYNYPSSGLNQNRNMTIVLKSYEPNDIAGLVEIASAKAISRNTGVLLGYKLNDICSKMNRKDLKFSNGWISASATKSREHLFAKFVDQSSGTDPCEKINNVETEQQMYWSTSSEMRDLLSKQGIPYNSVSVATIGGLN